MTKLDRVNPTEKVRVLAKDIIDTIDIIDNVLRAISYNNKTSNLLYRLEIRRDMLEGMVANKDERE
jgi:hypothetical protein